MNVLQLDLKLAQLVEEARKTMTMNEIMHSFNSTLKMVVRSVTAEGVEELRKEENPFNPW